MSFVLRYNYIVLITIVFEFESGWGWIGGTMQFFSIKKSIFSNFVFPTVSAQSSHFEII